MKRLAFGVGAGVLAVLLAVAIAEVFVRVANPNPRRVMFREDVLHGFHQVEGVWMWHDMRGYDPPRPVVLEDQDCEKDGAFVVMVVGDSILNGVDLDPSDVATVLLKERLSPTGEPRVCVVNLAVPGFTLVQGLARVEAHLARVVPDVLVVEMWGGAPQSPQRIGDTIYFFRGQSRDALGNANPLGLPPGLNAGLIDHVRLYEYVVLSWPEDDRDARYDLAPHLPQLDRIVDRVEAHGGEVLGLMPARLSFPFDAQPEALFRENAQWVDWVQARDLRLVKLWEAFDGRDPATMAMDPVHLNAAGQAALADVLAETLQPTFTRWRAKQRPVSSEYQAP